MILSDTDIKKALTNKQIKISPMPDLKVALGTVSVDLKLGHDFLVYRTTSRPYIDVADKESFDLLTEKVSKKKGESFVLHPRDFVLGATLENIELPDTLAGRLEGKSSLGRLGLVIHSTAGKVDPGFKGKLVLEITNIGTVPIMLYPEMRICQLLFEQLSSPTSQAYTDRKSSKYKFQKGATSSKF
ncbi:MAG TPA: dCTP deaminase [Patescibacteria group bacterium]|nr:dCTP deaminase [Patescibacteria group bacterium]